VDAGVRDLLIVTGGNNAGDFLRLLGNGKAFGLPHINYTHQEGEGGIADALRLAEHFAGSDKIIVMLGDNVVEKDIRRGVAAFRRQKRGARIYLKEVPNPQEYGVAELRGKRVVRIVEKPRRPKSNLAVIGIYMYDSSVFDIISTLTPSGRGELEITDVNNAYISRSQLEYEILDGWWADAGGSAQKLLETSIRIARQRGLKL
jgi:glucose-1-phosphate thymidylyltransferase